MPKNIQIYQLADAVETEADFLQFARALLADRLDEVEQQKTTPIDPSGRGPDGWENHTIEAFLESMIAWIEDAHHERPLSDPPSWKRFASILLMGSRYE